jgi:tetratricopeptide (TPR) repeat protein
MFCNQCGAKLADAAKVCPACGYLVAGQGTSQQDLDAESYAPEATPEIIALPEPPPQSDVKEGRRGCGWAMIAGMVAGVAVLLVIALALLGVYQGMQDRTRLNRAAATDHYQRGLEQLALQNYEIALAEFELAVQLDPRNREAGAKLAEVGALLSSRPTATSALRYQSTVMLYNEAREFYNRGDWAGVISKLEQVRSIDPDYEREQATALLVEAYYKVGLELEEQNRMEEAIRYFDQVLALQPMDGTARERKRLASLYLSGLGYWGANWQGAIESFSVLYQLEPDYKDTRQRLYDAQVAYADTLYESRNWCAARDHYDSALEMAVAESVKIKREDAARNCAITPAPTGTPGPSGTYVGRVTKVEDVGRQEAMMIRGQVFDAQGNPVIGTRVGLSAFDWSASPALTNEQGVFAFDGLANPVTYTVTLLDLPCVPSLVNGEWSKLAWVEFRPQP